MKFIKEQLQNLKTMTVATYGVFLGTNIVLDLYDAI